MKGIGKKDKENGRQINRRGDGAPRRQRESEETERENEKWRGVREEGEKREKK